MQPRLLLSIAFALMFVNACAGTGQPGDTGQSNPAPAILESDTHSAAFPAELPVDFRQPWETGYKASSASDPASEFVPGREWFLASMEGVNEYGEAASLTSAAGAVSYSIYRIPLGGDQPGTLAADVNLLDDGLGSPSRYYLGLANYGSGRWEWHGPFTDNHVRLSYGERIAAGGDFLSSVQNTFVCVLVHDGNTIDLVGLGLDAFDDADTTGPPAPLGLAATPVAGGLELTWNAVAVADLTGYRIHYSASTFVNPASAGVQDTGMLEGSTRFLLSGLTARTYVRLSSMDHSGNSGPASGIISALPLTGDSPSILLTTDLVSGGIGAAAVLTAAGADTYDFDTDGDGIFEITGNTSGSVTVDTSRTGIIRPRVRGMSSGGTAVALGAVSLIITGNSRPVANASATPTSGDTPLAVSFSGAESADFDGSIVGGGWDFDGDGIYNVWDDTDIVHVTAANATFTKPGVYNAKLRVVDDQGAWDVDTVTIIVGGNDPSNFKPTAVLTADVTGGSIPLLVNFDASGSTDSDGSIVNYEWDFNGDGQYDSYGSSSTATHNYTYADYHACGLLVTDDDGAQHSTTLNIAARNNTWVIKTVDDDTDVGRHSSLVVVDGHPAISYYDSDNANLIYVRATDVNGEAWGSPVIADDSPLVGEYTSMVVVDGNPAISYYDKENFALKYVRASDAQGSSWNMPVAVDVDFLVGKYTSMAIVDGRPAICYRDDTFHDLKFVRATDSRGTTWGSPQRPDNSEDVGVRPSMAIVDGNPAISYVDVANSDIKYIRASGVDGSTWFSPVIVAANSTEVRATSLLVVNGRPAISYYQDWTGGTRYVRADDADGSAWGSSQNLDGGGFGGGYPSMAIVDGFPAACFTSQVTGNLRYVAAKDADGTDWNTPILVDDSIIRIEVSMVIVNGSPAISYSDGIDGNLKYARLY